MMRTKAIQIRDSGTNIPALAMKFGPEEDREDPLAMNEIRIAKRAGFTDLSNYLILMRLVDLKTNYDPHKWGDNRSMVIAHYALAGRLDEPTCRKLGLVYSRCVEFAFWNINRVSPVIDVEYMMGATDTIKEFE